MQRSMMRLCLLLLVLPSFAACSGELGPPLAGDADAPDDGGLEDADVDPEDADVDSGDADRDGDDAGGDADADADADADVEVPDDGDVPDSDPEPELTVTLTATPETVVPGGEAELRATVTGAAGAATVVSLAMDGEALGEMIAAGEGSFERSVTWEEANSVQVFDFLASEARDLVATARDGDGRRATAAATVSFRCDAAGTLAACSGTCVDLDTDEDNCGRCGRVCDGEECLDGFCGGPVGFSSCFQVADDGVPFYEDCSDYCESQGTVCSGDACEEGEYTGGHGFSNLESCQTFLDTGSPGSGQFQSLCCSRNFDGLVGGLPTYAVCCCVTE